MVVLSDLCHQVSSFFGLDRHPESKNQSSYVTDLKQRLQEAYKAATKASGDAQHRQKCLYDLKIRGATLQPGDRVLVRSLAFEGEHKLSNRWHEDVYIVEAQPNSDVYCPQRIGQEV